MSLNEMEEGMKSKLCPTDCRWGKLPCNSHYTFIHHWITCADCILMLLSQASSRYS